MKDKLRNSEELCVSKDTFTLTTGDLYWLYDSLRGEPNKIIRDLLKRRFNNARKRFPTKKDRAEACIQFVKKNLYEFEKSESDIKFLHEFLALQQPDRVLYVFRTLWRGFTDEDINSIKRSVEKDKMKLLTGVDKSTRKNEKAIKNAQLLGLQQREEVYRSNKNKLKMLREDINKYFYDTDLCTFSKCVNRTLYRRRHFIALSYLFKDDYSGLQSRLHLLDPDFIDFPLRFMVHIPDKWYGNLQELWKEGKTKEEIVHSLIKICSRPTFFQGLRDKYEQIYNKFSHINSNIPQRTNVIKEIEISYNSKCYCAVTLLAVTSVEGILWDFAEYLNKKNIRIFKIKRGGKKPKRNPYLWDFKEKKYVNFLRSGYPKCSENQYITSARQLLEKTRLGEYIHLQVCNYLIDEFYDERNDLLHGNLLAHQEMALCALLCLQAILFDSENFMKMV